jgi:carbamoyltransferase
MAVILGINASHADSAACLVVDGKLIGAVAEERLGPRIKHSSAFPEFAIRHLLSDSGVTLKDISHVAVARDTSMSKYARFSYAIKNLNSSYQAAIEHFLRAQRDNDLHKKIALVCEKDITQAKFKIVNVEHHLAHIASAYYLSPFDSITAGFSYDGSGDFVSMMAAKCEGKSIEVIDRVHLPYSLGFFYTALCQFIGFDRFGEEYKVMGLAPYGHDLYREQMDRLVNLSTPWFKLNTDYFGMHKGKSSGAKDQAGDIEMGQFYTNKMTELFGKPRKRGDPISQREMDIARSTQVKFEESAIHCVNNLHKLVETNQIAMAGGCSLNGVTNAKILRDTPFKKQYIQPAASDDGTCLGAAFYTWHQVLGNEQRFEMKHAFWGPQYDLDQLVKVVKDSKFLICKCESQEELIERAAKLLSSGLVMGWYQGRSEWGPRALGQRSILANPIVPSMKEMINAKIKRRESFRPFAPSVLREDAHIYFEQEVDSPFMMHVVKVRSEWRDRLPAVTHIDGTGRLQTVDPQSNPLFYGLLRKFKQETGIGMLLNTSFNENEPVVDTPDQAYDCFTRTQMDALCLGLYIFQKIST